MLQSIVKRNLLKYSAGKAIFCPKCQVIADYRRWVIWQSPSGQCGEHCDKCHREILAKVHDDKPQAYLTSNGWSFDTLVDFDKPERKAKTPVQMPQKAGKDLDTYLRRTILACHKLDRPERLKTRFPTAFHGGMDQCTHNDDGEWSSQSSTKYYVDRFCEINHLKVA